MKIAVRAVFIALVVLVGPHPAASAVSVDGVLDPDYGTALSTQTTQTQYGDATNGQSDFTTGSELDQLYGYVADGVLHVFVAGNVTFFWTLEGATAWQPADLFIDVGPGGQNVLVSGNPSVDPAYDIAHLAGLTFDSGFAPDYWFSIGGNVGSWPQLKAYSTSLPAGGGGTAACLGSTTAGAGTLAGGTNPYGIQATLDDRNVGGVDAGCGGASGAGVVTGIEWAIPLAAIGSPTECIRICALVSRGDHAFVSNQVLGPLPPGTCNPGAPAGVNFASIAGDQFVTICPAPTPAHAVRWGELKTLYR